jgi:hypothetical protein
VGSPVHPPEVGTVIEGLRGRLGAEAVLDAPTGDIAATVDVTRTVSAAVVESASPLSTKASR